MTTASTFSATVTVPADLSSKSPVFFDVTVASTARGLEETVNRRYSAFDALACKLRQDEICIGAPELPCKCALLDAKLFSATQRNAST